MSILVADLEEAAAVDGLLNPGVYEVKIKEAVIQPKGEKEQLQVKFEVIGGQTQNDGSEPEGQNVVSWIWTSGFETFKDKGTFAKKTLASFLKAGDFPLDEEVEEADMIGVEMRIRLVSGEDQDGDARIVIKKYLPAE